MARLAVAAILLLVIANGGELNAEPAASINPSEVTGVPDAYGAYYEAEAVQSNSLPGSSAKVQESPVDVDHKGFISLLAHKHHRHHHCRHGHRHGLLRQDQDVYRFYRPRDGFHAQEKQLTEVPTELARGEEHREEVVLPVAEPDPDSRRDTAVPAGEVQLPAFHGEQEDDEEMGRAWRRFRRFRHHHHRHHHHQDEQEEDDEHEQAEQGSPVKKFRFHHHDDHDGDEAESATPMRSKRFPHDEDDELEEEMARRWIRKALTRSSLHHHGRRFHHHLHFIHRSEDAAGDDEEKGGVVMRWLKDLVNRF
ncbi:hypothetical protein GUJ93_ZPchr0002g25480 [Zizania palustris]|uniref:Uncharacterized protein n=1 Tax=Zizania palustris TaxID=103762 RepID=A0A8J5S9I9_ZIZPA|nr:hypothetical protein GUJ93_ZPchr0002g25480 [Zizania palustris]